MSSDHSQKLVYNIPAPGDRRPSWVGIWELTPRMATGGQLVYVYDPKDKDRGRNVECHLGDGPALITDGYGGWSQVNRPRSKALTQWDGVNGFTMSVPVIISGWFHDSSVESRIRRLEQLARNSEGEDEPSVVAITLPGDAPRDADTFLWVINNIEWGDSRRRSDDGQRTYQEGTLTCFEYVRPDIVKLSPAQARKQTKKKVIKKAPKRSHHK